MLSYISGLQQERCTFDFENVAFKNPAGANLQDLIRDNALKTGTTICGVVCKDGVVLAADARCTAGHVVFEKRVEKVINLAPNIAAAGAGIAGDLMHVRAGLKSDLALHARTLQRLPRVETAIRRLQTQLFKYQGYVQVALIVGGCNANGEPILAYVSPDGYSYRQPFMAMGSGGYFASSVLEAGYHPELTVDVAKDLVADAIEAGIRHDLGSGTHVDVVVIRSNAPTREERTVAYRSPTN
eukprot:Gregarina_sp_Pseudo_9__5397@NODE_65_length_4632_cov_53_918354_g60_i0_p3_GENE_NODE_65_length_4632_cov_53_918354_g60_i0NODE_65_length_4632_cov_53_918354_g60_i0_p3_ORF_typecomplete_len241_score28_20Proteasome/PF00227_26/1_4e40_NODE_65_length_4632_cov_53_918354_g60_i038074529